MKKREFGCETDSPRPLFIDGQELWRCPRRPFLEETGLYSQLFWFYKQFLNGFLPEDGGLNSQPNKLMEAFHIIANAVADGEREKKEMERRRQNRISGVRQKALR